MHKRPACSGAPVILLTQVRRGAHPTPRALGRGPCRRRPTRSAGASMRRSGAGRERGGIDCKNRAGDGGDERMREAERRWPRRPVRVRGGSAGVFHAETRRTARARGELLRIAFDAHAHGSSASTIPSDFSGPAERSLRLALRFCVKSRCERGVPRPASARSGCSPRLRVKPQVQIPRLASLARDDIGEPRGQSRRL